MAISRIAIWTVAGVAIAGAVVVVSGWPKLAAVYAVIVVQSLFPSALSWDSHGAYVKCAGAIADAAKWPTAPLDACRAMHMCANEAPLSEPQRAALAAAVKRTPGCGES